MCGIAGYFLKKETRNSRQNIAKLLTSIKKRGPDDEGVCLISSGRGEYRSYKTDKTVQVLSHSLSHIRSVENNFEHNIALLHTRFSIIDLSEGGHQPFVSADGSVIVVFNGEIYNYIELRSELSALGVRFRTKSDTEVLVEGYRVWQDALWQKMNGFWAIALYDFRNNSFILSRDRVGIAPLYYRDLHHGLYFASTIQALVDISPHDIQVNDDVMIGFVQTGIKDHDNSTYYTQIKSIPSATYITFPARWHIVEDAKQNTFWALPASRLDKINYPFQDAVKDYRETFFNAVELRLRADVKIAFELSGGLDSSSVVAVAALLRNNNITTYTVDVKGASDLPYAKSMLGRYPIDFRVLEALEDNFINDYGEFSLLMDEPYDNPNDYTHNRMLRIMKQHGFNVVITGAGGDEVLAGYESAFWPKVYDELRYKDCMSYFFADLYEFNKRFKTLQSTTQTLQHYIVDPFKYLYTWIVQKNKKVGILPLTSALKHQKQYQALSAHEQSIYHFKVASLPYYMRSSDYFTMSIPVEHRFPLLDYRMVELGLKMPYEYLFNRGWTKYILRKAMEPYLPKTIIWRRKKSGFYFPYQQYLSAHRTAFEPLLTYLKYINFPQEPIDNYEHLLRTDAVALWRLISTAIWIKYNLKKSAGVS